MTGHLTTVRSNEWSRATMLRQVALVRDYGDAAATAALLLDCDGCGWRATADTHAESLAVRLAHEQAPRPWVSCPCGWVGTEGHACRAALVTS